MLDIGSVLIRDDGSAAELEFNSKVGLVVDIGAVLPNENGVVDFTFDDSDLETLLLVYVEGVFDLRGL